MKIAINGERLGIKHFAGPEIYTLNIILGLGKVDRANFYTIFLHHRPSDEIYAQLKHLPPNFEVKVIPKVFSWTQVSLALALWTASMNKATKYDVLFSAVHTIPILAFPRVKMFSMIHGLEFRTNQERSTFPFLLGLPEKIVVALSHWLVVPSQATKTAILESRWKIRNREITVIPEGVSSKFSHTTQNVDAILEKYKIPQEPYLIFVSTIQPRKNLKSIVEALAILKQKHNKRVNLVVCGKKGWNYEEEIASPEKFGVGEQVFFAGRVSDEDLIPLLSNAKAFISASFDEGFGLTVLEAMACETPLIISEIPAHKALAGDLAVYMDPYSVEDIASKVNSVWEEAPESTAERVKKAKERANRYSWENSAKQLKEILEIR